MTPKCGIFFSHFKSSQKKAEISGTVDLTLLFEANDFIQHSIKQNNFHVTSLQIYKKLFDFFFKLLELLENEFYK
jgi:hypothetical protein